MGQHGLSHAAGGGVGLGLARLDSFALFIYAMLCMKVDWRAGRGGGGTYALLLLLLLLPGSDGRAKAGTWISEGRCLSPVGGLGLGCVPALGFREVVCWGLK